MPRVKVKSKAEEIKDWKGADAALAEIAKNRTKIESEEADYNHNEQILRKKLTDRHAPLKERIEALEQGLEKFCMDHRADFGEKKSRELNHGIVSFRLGTPKVIKTIKATWEGVLDLVKLSPLKAVLVRTKEELNKDEVISQAALYKSSGGEQGLSAEKLASVGLGVEQEETFGYDIKKAIEN